MRFLIVEDSEDDFLLLRAYLEREGFGRDTLRVETEEEMVSALAEGTFDVVLADYRLPSFSATAALAVLHAAGCDLPFIVVSGTIGEEVAVGLMRAGANDYVLKDNLTRLASAIRREIQQAEHRHAERAALLDLERSERRFRSLFEHATDLIALSDARGRFLAANPAALALTGYTAEEVERLGFTDLIPEEDQAREPIRFAELMAGGAIRTNRRLRRKNGTLLTLEVCAKLLPDGQLLSIGRDITERKAAEVALKTSEMRYRSLVERSPDPIFTLDCDGVVIATNPAMITLGGWQDEAAVVGHDFREFLHPDDLAAAERDLRATLEGLAVTAAEYRVRTRSGDYVLLETRPSPVVENGRTIGLFSMARDITARRRAEGERERLARDMELLLDSAYEGIAAVDHGGRCTLINPAACLMLRIAPADIVGRDFHSLVHVTGCDPESCGLVHALSRGEKQPPADTILYRTDRSTFQATLSAAPMKEGSETRGAVVSFTDVTQQRAMEVELERAARLGALGQMAATLAHEFNNVLMGIQPFAEMLARSAGTDDARRAVQHIQQSVQRGRRVTEEVLRFGRSSEPARKPIEGTRLLSNVAEEARAMMPEVDVRLDVGTESLLVEGDSEQLTQVFLNLAVNARDAMPEGGTLSLSIGCPCETTACSPFIAAGQVHFVVRDTGCGIPPVVRDRLFEPFFTTKRRGTGLGLPVAHQIIAAHGGHLTVCSREGEGTEVHILLPRAHPRAEDLAKQDAPALPVPISSVLLVEDEELIALGISALFETEAIHCKWVDRGAAAVAAVEERMPDAVILDVGLPDIPGTEVFDRLRARWPDLLIVFATGHGDEEKLARHLAMSRVAFLRKPFPFPVLMEVLRSAGHVVHRS